MPTSTSVATAAVREPKYRKRLNKEQLAVLNLLLDFRFASSELIALSSGKKTNKHVQKRLKILEDQDYIAKRYDKSYKLRGKPAAYYLRPKGAQALIQFTKRDPDLPVNIKRIYKDKDVSEGFIQHCLNILSTCLTLRATYGNRVEWFTKSRLSYEHYDYFPQPLPDLCLRLTTKGHEQYFFLDIFEDTQPFFVLVRRIKKYLEYADSDEWIEDEMPIFLFVVANKSVHKRLRKRLAKELSESYEEVTYATTRIEYATNQTYKDEIWLLIDEDGDDPDDAPEPVTLAEFD